MTQPKCREKSQNRFLKTGSVTNVRMRTHHSCLRDLEENDAESALIPTVPNAVPYQYEPRRPTAPVIAYETDSDVTSDSESEEDLNARVGNTEW